MTNLLNNKWVSMLFKGGLFPLISKGLSLVIVYVFYVFITQRFGEQTTGEFALFFTLLSILSVFTKLGLDTSIVKQISSRINHEGKNEIKSVYLRILTLVFLVSTILSVAVFFLGDFLTSQFLEEGSQLFVYLPIGLLLFSLISINSESLRGLQKLSLYSLFQNFSLFGIALIGVILFNQDLFSSFIGSLTLLMALSFILILKALPKGDKIKVSSKGLLEESFPMFLSNSAFFIMTWADVIMLSYFLTEDQTGIYNNASKVANLNIVFLFAINAIAAPKLAEFKAKNDESSIKAFTQTTSKYSIMLSMPILIVILLFSEELLGLFSDKSMEGYVVLMVLALGQFFNAACGSVVNVLNMTGYEKNARNVIMVTTVLNLILNYLLIPVYGILGAAISTAISVFVWNFWSVLIIYKKFNFISITMPWKKI